MTTRAKHGIRRARRCQLSVPGSSEKMMIKAAALELDHVFLDLKTPSHRVPNPARAA